MTSTLGGALASGTSFATGHVQRLSVDTISDFQSFLEMEREWTRVERQAGIPHPFLTHTWVRTWWECFGVGRRLHVVVVRDGGEIIAIAPFMVSEGRLYGMRVRWLEFIYNAHTPRFDFIVTRDAESAYDAIWQCLLDQRTIWDAMRLCQLEEGAAGLDEMRRVSAISGFRLGLWPSGESPYIPMSGTWENFQMKGIGRKHRSNLRNRWKRLSQLGQVETETVTRADDARQALRDGLRIEALAWKQQNGTAIQSSPDVQLFYSRLAQRAALQGWLRLHFLSLDGRRIAFDYSLQFRNRMFLLKPGYDPEFSTYSPYNLLCARVLEEGFAAGIEEFDFLGVSEDWKRTWTSQARRHYWLYAFPCDLRSRLMHSAKFRLVPALQKQPLYRKLRDRWTGQVQSNGASHSPAVPAQDDGLAANVEA